MQQAVSIQNSDSRWSSLHKAGAGAALIAGASLLVGMISLVISILQPGTNSWLLLFQSNWLVKIFALHAGFNNIQSDLHGFNLLDIVILLLVAVMCISLSTVFKRGRKAWSLIAFALSLVATILFLITQEAGRSTVMLAVLIISIVMFGAKTFSKVTIYMGILASVSLFVGDLTVGIQSNAITICFGIGYVLLTAWFFLMARSLFRLDGA